MLKLSDEATIHAVELWGSFVPFEYEGDTYIPISHDFWVRMSETSEGHYTPVESTFEDVARIPDFYHSVAYTMRGVADLGNATYATGLLKFEVLKVPEHLKALLAIYTGIFFSDIERLTGAFFEHSDSDYYVHLRMERAHYVLSNEAPKDLKACTVLGLKESAPRLSNVPDYMAHLSLYEIKPLGVGTFKGDTVPVGRVSCVCDGTLYSVYMYFMECAPSTD